MTVPSGASYKTRRPPLGLTQAAEYLGVNPRWIRRAVHERRIPYAKVGRLLRFLPDDLDRYLEERRFEPTPEARDQR